MNDLGMETVALIQVCFVGSGAFSLLLFRWQKSLTSHCLQSCSEENFEPNDNKLGPFSQVITGNCDISEGQSLELDGLTQTLQTSGEFCHHRKPASSSRLFWKAACHSGFRGLNHTSAPEKAGIKI